MTFTVEDVLREMRAVVKEYGEDYVYKFPSGTEWHGQCVYVSDDKPSCLIGHVVMRLAPDKIEDLKWADKGYGGTAADQLLNFLGEDFWTPEAGDVATAAQEYQDEGHPWGAALEKAERAASRGV